MSRKDYELLAAALRASRPADNRYQAQWDLTVCKVAEALKSDGRNFDAKKFMAACVR